MCPGIEKLSISSHESNKSFLAIIREALSQSKNAHLADHANNIFLEWTKAN